MVFPSLALLQLLLTPCQLLDILNMTSVGDLHIVEVVSDLVRRGFRTLFMRQRSSPESDSVVGKTSSMINVTQYLGILISRRLP